MAIKYTYEEVKTIVESFGYELISKEYIGIDEKLIIKDKHGYYYIISFYNLKIGNKPFIAYKSNPFSIQNIKLWCKLNNKPFELISDKYEKATKKLKWKCLKDGCGEVFEATWNNISHITFPKGCSFCAGKQVGKSNCLATKKPDLAKEWHPTKNGELTPYDVTWCSDKEVWWLCHKNKEHEWMAHINSRSNKDSNCPYCSGRYATKENNLLVNNPELCKDWDYSKNDKSPDEYTPNSTKSVWWKCKDCGYEWEVKITYRNNGSGCHQCNNSRGEKECKRVLINKNFIEINPSSFKKLSNIDKNKDIYFISQKKFKNLLGLGGGLLSYDFYIPKLKLLIEYQGIQHKQFTSSFHRTEEDFEKQLEHDKRKREYAEKNNINLLEIWYWDFDNIEQILNNYLINKYNTKE